MQATPQACVSLYLQVEIELSASYKYTSLNCSYRTYHSVVNCVVSYAQATHTVLPHLLTISHSFVCINGPLLRMVKAASTLDKILRLNLEWFLQGLRFMGSLTKFQYTTHTTSTCGDKVGIKSKQDHVGCHPVIVSQASTFPHKEEHLFSSYNSSDIAAYVHLWVDYSVLCKPRSV